jgi:hypothetical protein
MGQAAGDLAVDGRCDARFRHVGEALAENFAQHGEVGVAVAVTIDGKPVVDLWAGHADAARMRPWTRDTIVNIASATKGLTATCAPPSRLRAARPGLPGHRLLAAIPRYRLRVIHRRCLRMPWRRRLDRLRRPRRTHRLRLHHEPDAGRDAARSACATPHRRTLRLAVTSNVRSCLQNRINPFPAAGRHRPRLVSRW